MRYSLAQFSAVTGDGEADDTLPFLDACRQIPNGASVEWPEDYRLRVTDALVLAVRNRIRFVSSQDPRDIVPQVPHAGIIYDGRPGGDVLVLDRCRRIELEGIAISATTHNEATGGANRCLVLDQLAAGGDISSKIRLVRCQVTLGLRNPDGIAISNAARSGNNCEYPTLDRVKIVGGAGGAGLVRWYGRFASRNDNGISIEAGSNRALAAKPGTFRASDMATSERFVIANALGRFESRVVNAVSDREALLADRSPIAFVKAYATIGESFGTGFYNGPSFNAKRLQFTDVEIYGCRFGVHSMGGSQQLLQPNFGDNEVDIFIEGNQADPSWEFGTQSENSRAHLWNLSGAAYTIGAGSRFACSGIAPGSTYLDGGKIGGGDIILADGVSFDEDPMAAGARCWGLETAARFVDWRSVTYPSTWTRRDIGCDPTQLSDACTIHVLGGRADAARFSVEEWISGQVPHARLRASGGIGAIQGMAFNRVRVAELQPGEWTMQRIYRTGSSKRVQLVLRDWDGEYRTATLATGKADPQED